MSESFSRSYPVGRRRVRFVVPLPLASGITTGAAWWWPDVPAGSDLSVDEWGQYEHARNAFHADLGEACGVIFRGEAVN